MLVKIIQVVTYFLLIRADSTQQKFGHDYSPHYLILSWWFWSVLCSVVYLLYYASFLLTYEPTDTLKFILTGRCLKSQSGHHSATRSNTHTFYLVSLPDDVERRRRRRRRRRTTTTTKRRRRRRGRGRGRGGGEGEEGEVRAAKKDSIWNKYHMPQHVIFRCKLSLLYHWACRNWHYSYLNMRSWDLKDIFKIACKSCSS